MFVSINFLRFWANPQKYQTLVPAKNSHLKVYLNRYYTHLFHWSCRPSCDSATSRSNFNTKESPIGAINQVHDNKKEPKEITFQLWEFLIL